MTGQEYVNSIDHDQWSQFIKDKAYEEFDRLWALGDVMSVALEEFNNDVYDECVQNGIDCGLVKEEDE
jgi:hypothetical protein